MQYFVRVGVIAIGLGLGLLACNSKPKPGETCQAKSTSCVDGQSRLACIEGHYQALACHGAGGCHDTTCDTTRAAETDSCEDEGTSACSIDGSLKLICRIGRWRADQKCTGATGCTVKDKAVSCDQTLAAVEKPAEKAAAPPEPRTAGHRPKQPKPPKKAR